MKKILGILAATFLLTACSLDPMADVKDNILATLKANSISNTEFTAFLEKNGKKLENANFDPILIGITMPTEGELDSSFYDEIIVGLSKIARESKKEEVLGILLQNSNEGVRSDVAKNPVIPGKFQEILSKDPNPLVRTYLAANKNLQTSLAETLSTDTAESVRRPLAQNPSVVFTILEKFVEDENPEVQRSLARNKNLTVELMTEMVEKSLDSTILELIKRTDFPADLLKKVQEERPQLFEETPNIP